MSYGTSNRIPMRSPLFGWVRKACFFQPIQSSPLAIGWRKAEGLMTDFNRATILSLVTDHKYLAPF